MTVWKGNKYVYQFNHDVLFLLPSIDDMKTISISSHDEEDFSCFDLGPEICKEVEMGIKECIIEDIGTFNNCFMRLWCPNPGNNIEILIRDYDGTIILDVTDIISQYNRSNENLINTRTEMEDNADFVEGTADPNYVITLGDNERTDYTEKEKYEEENPPEPEVPEDPTVDEGLPYNKIIFSEDGSYVSGKLDGIEVDQTTINGMTLLTVGSPGTYTLSGHVKNMSLNIRKDRGKVYLKLDDLLIDNANTFADSNKDYPVIEAKDGNLLNIILENINTINGSQTYREAEPIIKIGENGSLSITGSGMVTFEISPGEVIGSKSNVSINSNVNMSQITGTAIKAKGQEVDILGGNLNIDGCFEDGITAETVKIINGAVAIETVYSHGATQHYGYMTEAYNYIFEDEGLEKERVNIFVGSHKGINAGTEARINQYNSVSPDTGFEVGRSYTSRSTGGFYMQNGSLTIDTSATGLKCNKIYGTTSYVPTKDSSLYIIGAPDNAIHSNGTVSITGGTINLKASGNGIVGTDVKITGRTVINIHDSYRGMEAKSFSIGSSGDYVEDPNITIYSRDDGVCAISKTVTYIYDTDRNTETGYYKTTKYLGGNKYIHYNGLITTYINSEMTTYYFIDSNTIPYKCLGHGINCNGTFYAYGGRVVVHGESTGDDSPVVATEGFILGPNARMVLFGCDKGNNSIPASGNGVYVTFGNSGNTGVGEGGTSTIHIGENPFTDIARGSSVVLYRGTAVIEAIVNEYPCNFLLISNPQLISGRDYKLDANNRISTLTAITAV